MKEKSTKGIWKVISASSMGTMIEWYDFYIFGSLAVVISTKFFPADNPTAAFLATLATFAVGFVVRPFGALFFGRLGDIIGRKYTFMVTLLLMGGATFLIGCIPSYETIGFMAPLLVLILRMLQGLALGGEYGGAATYVAEHAPVGQRGYWTSWIQTTATVGLFISLMVILATRNILTPEEFDEWGWRIPFWVSIVMVGVSYLIRKNMDESPVFAKAKSEGKTSTNPLKESFGNRYNLKFVLLALFGATMGQGVVWYTTSVKNKTEIVEKTTLLAELKETKKQTMDSIYTTHKEYTDGTTFQEIKTVHLENGTPIIVDGKPKGDSKTTVNINSSDEWSLVFLVFIQVIFVTMVYGPIAAFLVEMFPVKIRYTSMSLPYHVGNGIFGGLLPAISTYFVTNAKDLGHPEFYLEGLWYPIVIAAVSFVVGMIYIKNKDKNAHV